MLKLAVVCLIGTACGTAVHSTDTATPNATGLSATPSAASTATSTPRTPPRSSTSHPPVVVILMENEESSSVVGNTTGAPYISKTLIPSGTLFTNYYAVSHPSLRTAGRDRETLRPATAVERADRDAASHRWLGKLQPESVTELA